MRRGKTRTLDRDKPMGVLSSLFGAKAKERDEAKRRGLQVREVTRDLPAFAKNGELVSVDPDQCIRYAMARRARSAPTWSLVQRTPKTGANYPNGYLLKSSAPLPGALEEQLRKVAEAFSEEVFEFEGTAEDVAVYWEEWGGAAKVQELHGYLDRLASY
jgi:hypothetical protein